MNVLIVNNAAPYIHGGAEELAANLVMALNAVPGVQSELVRIPFCWDPAERLIDEMLLCRSLRLPNVDKVIGLKFPAYLIPHPNKTLWLLHQYRGAYDLYCPSGDLAGERGGVIREAIINSDNACFAECEKIFLNSPVTQRRLKYFNGVDGQVLYPPLNNPELFTGGENGNYIFAGGRVAPGKRQHLLIEAMSHVRAPIRLLIAGPPSSEDYAETLRGMVAERGLGDRIELNLGFYPRERIAAWVNGARACAYLPFDEDSLGYVTMEAFAAGKPVLTSSDSGGLLEIVSEETGVVATPEAKALAEGLEWLADPARARELGSAAAALWKARRLTWRDTVATLLDG